MKNKSNIIFWAVMGVLIIALLVYVAQGCTSTRKAVAAEQDNQIMECVERLIPTAPSKAVEHAARMSAEITAQAERAAQEAEQATDYDETVYEYQESDYADYSGSEYCYSGFPDEAAYNPLYNDNGPSRYMPGYANGHVETYYSSNVLYHNRTGEWEVDDEGFYHDPETGYYIVGVSTQEWYGDRPEGTVIDTGKGKAIVCDNGWTPEPTVDFYTNW